MRVNDRNATFLTLDHIIIIASIASFLYPFDSSLLAATHKPHTLFDSIPYIVYVMSRQRTILLIVVAVLYQVSGFSIISPKQILCSLQHSPRSITEKYNLRLRNSLDNENETVIKDLKIPLLLSDVFLPLPSFHLPDVLATLNVYSTPLNTALDQTIVEFAKDNTDSLLGHVCIGDDLSKWTGAVGCVSQVIETIDSVDSNKQLVCKGTFRFVVKQVLQEIPFPIVLVDELVDQEFPEIASNSNNNNEVEDTSSDPTECISRILSLLDEYCQQQLESAGDVSPLEQAILEETGNAIMPMVVQQIVMEKAAIAQVFRASYLDDSVISSHQILYAAALLAAEITDFSASQRQTLLAMTNSIERLVYVRSILEETVGMARARKMAEQITAATDEASKDLKIGTPQLPPWAKSIRKGTQVEYFWNEEYGWCRGEVIEDPIRIVDEILLTVRFFEDGETHRLPFSADEKVRWRPPSRLNDE